MIPLKPCFPWPPRGQESAFPIRSALELILMGLTPHSKGHMNSFQGSSNPGSRASSPRSTGWFHWIYVLGFVVLLQAGCATSKETRPTAEDAAAYDAGTIQIGDLVKVNFPGAPNLNFAQMVRVDGVLNAGQGKELKAVEKTSKALEEDLLKLFGADLIDKRVTVSVESAGFPVFVSGAVLRPGKLTVNRSVTVLEAIVEAGGFDMKRANLQKIQIVRQEKGVQRTFILDLDWDLSAPKSRPFHLRPSDIVVVPEKFIFF